MSSGNLLKLFFLDIESTGLSHEVNGVIQIAAQLVIDGQEVHRMNHKVRPFKGQLVTQEALTITNTTLEEIRGYPEPQEVFSSLKKTLGSFISKFDRMDKAFLVAYNAPFDSGFLRKFFENNGDKFYGSFFWHPPICVMQGAMNALAPERHLMPNFKLATVAEWLGLMKGDEKLHDAADDVDLTVKVYNHLVAAGCIRAESVAA